MNGHHGNSSSSKRTRRVRHALALLSIMALGLAASPAALADERGGPGAPSVQQLSPEALLYLLRKLPKRFASWSD